MKAIRYSRYGGPEVIQVVNEAIPTVGSKDILIRNMASTAAPSDVAFRKADPFITRFFDGFFSPKSIPGDVLAGIVEEVGSEVTHYQVGDKVYGSTGAQSKAMAEYLVVPENGGIAHIASNSSYADAAAIADGGSTALPFLRDHGKLKAGQHILINGGSGAIGTFAIQLAKLMGAQVTAVCSEKNAELVKALGADHFIDYNKEDFTKGSVKYDIIFDTVGKNSYKKSKGVLTNEGIFLTPVPTLGLIRDLVTALFSSKKVKFAATGLRDNKIKNEDFIYMSKLYSEGKLQSIISRQYKLEDVGQAQTLVETGHKVGHVILNI